MNILEKTFSKLFVVSWLQLKQAFYMCTYVNFMHIKKELKLWKPYCAMTRGCCQTFCLKQTSKLWNFYINNFNGSCHQP